MFETEEQRREAISAYHIDPTETTVIGDDYCRINRPEGTKIPSAYIFWAKDSPDDAEPTDKKAVCELICSIMV